MGRHLAAQRRARSVKGMLPPPPPEMTALQKSPTRAAPAIRTRRTASQEHREPPEGCHPRLMRRPSISTNHLRCCFRDQEATTSAEVPRHPTGHRLPTSMEEGHITHLLPTMRAGEAIMLPSIEAPTSPLPLIIMFTRTTSRLVIITIITLTISISTAAMLRRHIRRRLVSLHMGSSLRRILRQRQGTNMLERSTPRGILPPQRSNKSWSKMRRRKRKR